MAEGIKGVMDAVKVNQYRKGVKKRREERLKLLQAKRGRYKSMLEEEERDLFPADVSRRADPSSSVSFRVITAVLLFTLVFMVMKSDHPQLSNTQSFIRDVMTLDFNIDGVLALYEEAVGSQPGFLPQFLARDQGASFAEHDDYVLPVSGARLVSGFSPNQQGIVLVAGSSLPVEVIKEGWVTFVGEREGWGKVVIVDHGQGEESWYGHLEEIHVQLYDWVQQKDVIGTTRVREGSQEGLLYFALRQNDVFVDPLDVIPLD